LFDLVAVTLDVASLTQRLQVFVAFVPNILVRKVVNIHRTSTTPFAFEVSPFERFNPTGFPAEGL